MNGWHETKQVCTIQQVQLSWEHINWTQIKHEVENLQQKIFRETQIGNFRKVNQLQKLLVRSLFARRLAVRIITEINQGRNTPGINGKLYKTANEKEKLVENLKFKDYIPNPVRTVWIPKPNGDKRKLGIPTIRDRAMQTLCLLAMDPEWEAKFEPHSFGFRPGRSALDTVHHIYSTLMHQKGRRPHPGWVLDADISKCFDNIDHEALLAKIKGSPFQKTIKGWLKVGTVSKIGFERTMKGTPQGGAISPLLANIALDGLERQFGIYTRTGNYKSPAHRSGQDKDVALFRYADDFIILAPSKESLINYILPKVRIFLSKVGLSLNEGKTRILNVSEGFKFLGFTFQRFYRRDGSIRVLLFVPSRERLDRFLTNLKKYIRYYWNKDVKELIKGLNRRIIGFCNYFKWSSAYKAFSYLSHRIWELLWRWACRRHHKRNITWIRQYYWKTVGNSNWIFSHQGVHMREPYTLCAQWWKYPKVRIHTSPYDLTAFNYWKERRERYKRSKP